MRSTDTWVGQVKLYIRVYIYIYDTYTRLERENENKKQAKRKPVRESGYKVFLVLTVLSTLILSGKIKS